MPAINLMHHNAMDFNSHILRQLKLRKLRMQLCGWFLLENNAQSGLSSLLNQPRGTIKTYPSVTGYCHQFGRKCHHFAAF